MSVLSRLYNFVIDAAAKLDEISARGLSSWIELLAAIHVLQSQAQALLDMLTRVAAELGYAPSSPREAAELLVAEKIISRDEYMFVKKLIGFRNIVVHEYIRVDEDLVKRIIARKEYRRVVLLASKLLEEASRRGLDP